MKDHLYNSRLSMIVERGLNERGSIEFEPESKSGRINIFTAWLWKHINKRYSHHRHVKFATLGRWRKHIEASIDEDERSFKDLKEVFIFSLKDDFWKNKILSTEGLRRNFASAYDEMMRQRKKEIKKMNKPPVQRENADAYKVAG